MLSPNKGNELSACMTKQSTLLAAPAFKKPSHPFQTMPALFLCLQTVLHEAENHSASKHTFAAVKGLAAIC